MSYQTGTEIPFDVPHEVRWQHYWKARIENTEGYYRDVGSFIANVPEHLGNKGINIFAGSLGLAQIRQFFDAMYYPAAVVIRCAIPLKNGFWIIVFQYHEMARIIIQEGYGRLHRPDKGFPYFDIRMCQTTKDDDVRYRFKITWARRKAKKRKDVVKSGKV